MTSTLTTSNQIVIDIAGMSCGSCVEHVRAALSKVTGVHVDSVSPGRAILTVQGAANERDIREAIGQAGYEVRRFGGANLAPEPMGRAGASHAGGCGGHGKHGSAPASANRG